MATKWVGMLVCQWCGKQARVGIEKEGQGTTYRVMCPECGIMEQVAFHYPAGEKITRILEQRQSEVYQRLSSHHVPNI
ncbi:MAG: hypothetical protein QGI09_11445 [Dehalococcoidia bacterium]|nr:hypothetical protein [Dehalococcoidia bacterium]